MSLIIILGSCNNCLKKGKNPLRNIYPSISQIKDINPTKITIERWADANSFPPDSFVKEMKREIKADKSIDDYLNDPNNSTWILEKEKEYLNETNNWVVECAVTDKNQIKVIMWALAEPTEGGSMALMVRGT